ncbi:MAG: HNH endonuclease [Oscillospiraceae bacterium]|nr:HNH endonuclease [Oscillospiraceae bacterium]
MGNFIDLTGLTFGLLTVIERGPDRVLPSGNKAPRWWCKCACGSPDLVLKLGSALRDGSANSCGCLKHAPRKAEDLTGRRFGRLTVVRRAENGRRDSGLQFIRWECICDCGKTVVVEGGNLKKGHTKSCGCWHDEYVSGFGGHNKKTNSYEFTEDCVIGRTDCGEQFLIDPEDFELVKDYYWKPGKKGLLITQRWKDGKAALLHRVIMGAHAGEQVDHINHDRSDNRRSNLRIVTGPQNCMNKGIRRDNKTGATGVYRRSDASGWWAEIKCNGIRHSLGNYRSFAEAVAARKAAEEKYFGEYSYDNSIAAVPRIAV